MHRNNKNMTDIINEFLEGATSGMSGSKTAPGNLKIQGDQLIHFSTPILERYGDKFILNMSRYSVQTGRLQKLIGTLIDENRLVIVTRVQMDYKSSLKDFIGG